MQPHKVPFVDQIYLDLKVAIQKSIETEDHMFGVKEILESLNHHLQELTDEINKQKLNDQGVSSHELKLDRKKIILGVEKFKKLLIKIEKIYQKKQEKINALVELLPTTQDTPAKVSNPELVKYVEKKLQERAFKEYIASFNEKNK